MGDTPFVRPCTDCWPTSANIHEEACCCLEIGVWRRGRHGFAATVQLAPTSALRQVDCSLLMLKVQ